MNKVQRWFAISAVTMLSWTAVAEPAAAADVALNIASSMAPVCTGALYSMPNCDVVRFTLNIADPQFISGGAVMPVGNGLFGNFFVKTVKIQRASTAGFNFVGVLDILGPANVSLVPSWIAISTSSLVFALDAVAPINTPTPLSFDVRVSPALLVDYSKITYAATGSGQEIGTGSRTAEFSTVGIVSAVPEPVSMTLLGTGLIGLAGAARRRRSVTPV